MTVMSNSGGTGQVAIDESCFGGIGHALANYLKLSSKFIVLLDQVTVLLSAL